jgi:hypothetical protein
MKYVIVEDFSGLTFPIIFPEFVKHRDMVSQYVKPVAAGKVFLHEKEDENGENVITAFCQGEAISLGVKSRGKEDNELIERAFKSY